MIFSNKYKELIGKESLIQILDSIVTDDLNALGFKWNGDYIWYTDTKEGIRQIIKYERLKGEQGTFIWGVCFDFVPTISGNTLKWNRTEKTMTFHLFDSISEYVDSFDGGKITNGVASHWGKLTFEKSFKKLLRNNKQYILDWFSKCNDINCFIDIANAQINSNKMYYKLHYPNPKYVLIFLLAKSGQLDKSLTLLDNSSIDLTLKEKISQLIENK